MIDVEATLRGEGADPKAPACMKVRLLCAV